jgi:hypothetical protein
MNEEQYQYIKSLNGRKALYPLEIAAVFNIFRAIKGYDPGCETCNDNVKFVVERVYEQYNAYQPPQPIISASTQTQTTKTKKKK